MILELGKLVQEDLTEMFNRLEDPNNIKKIEREYYFIKKLEIESTIYPQIEIEQLDLCPDGKEEFDVWIKICSHMKKDELFEFLKTANNRTAAVLYLQDDKLPGKITIETFPKLEDLKK